MPTVFIFEYAHHRETAPEGTPLRGQPKKRLVDAATTTLFMVLVRMPTATAHGESVDVVLGEFDHL